MIILFMVCMPKPMARFAVYVKAVLILYVYYWDSTL